MAAGENFCLTEFQSWYHEPKKIGCRSTTTTMVMLSLLVLLTSIKPAIYGAHAAHDLPAILRNNPDYDKEEIPTHDEHRPTVVTISMYIEGMTSFRAQSNDFGIDIYFQERWHDKRLAHNGTKRILIKDAHVFNHIWHPDMYFANARTANFHEVTSPNFLVWLYPNGTLFYDCRISLTVICMLNLARYPLDSQSCHLRILSYAYDNDQLVLRWKPQSPIDINSEIRMPDMRLRRLESASRNDSYATGTWSCAIVTFKIDRELTHHIIQTYIPSALIVTISFFSFWLDVDSVPGRVSLSITTILTVATQNSAAKMALPQASDLKAIDIWMGACLTFVFGTMIEFTIVNFCVRRKTKMKPRMSAVLGLGEQVQRLIYTNQKLGSVDSPIHQKDVACRTVYFDDDNLGGLAQRGNGQDADYTEALLRRVGNGYSGSTPFDSKQNLAATIPSLLKGTEEWSRGQRITKTKKKAEERLLRAEENRKLAQSIDRKSRVCFPLAFILFNIAYWWYYLRTSAIEQFH